jgi:hypothetical protein
MKPEKAMPEDLKRSYLHAQRRVIADVQGKIQLLEALYKNRSQKPPVPLSYDLKQAANYLDLYIFKGAGLKALVPIWRPS